MAGDFDIGPADYEADMSENGKGDSPRPIVIDAETYKIRNIIQFNIPPSHNFGGIALNHPPIDKIHQKISFSCERSINYIVLIISYMAMVKSIFIL